MHNDFNVRRLQFVLIIIYFASEMMSDLYTINHSE